MYMYIYMRKVIPQNRHIVTRYLVIYWFTHGLLFIYKKIKRYLSCNLTVRIIHRDSYIWKPIAIILLDWNHLRKTITQNINTIKWYSLNLLMCLVIYCHRYLRLITQFICISFFGIKYGICLILIYDFINHPPPSIKGFCLNLSRLGWGTLKTVAGCLRVFLFRQSMNSKHPYFISCMCMYGWCVAYFICTCSWHWFCNVWICLSIAWKLVYLFLWWNKYMCMLL